MKTNLSILRNQPLLIPNKNFTEWKGYIDIRADQYKIFIQCPHFPYTKNISLHGEDALNDLINTEKLEQIKGRGFKLDKFLKYFVRSLNLLSPCKLPSLNDIRQTYYLLKELEDIQANIVSVSDNLDVVSFIYKDLDDRDHSLSVRTGKYLVIEHVDLPDIAVENLKMINTSISRLFKQFCLEIDSRQDLFHVLDLIDEQTTVLEPAQPTRQNIYRKIGISESVAIQVTLKPLDVFSCPEINIVGEHHSVSDFEATLLSNLIEFGWDEDRNIIENLARLLGIKEFPDLSNHVACTQATLGSGDCNICLSVRHADTDQVPIKLCSNQKCSSVYHEICLSKWLASIPTNEISFETVSGKCPACKQDIVCRFIDEDD